MKRLVLALAMAIFLMVGCSGDDPFTAIYEESVASDANCDDEIQDVIDALGLPDDLDAYDTSDGYHSWTYWYWCEGIAYSFTWGIYSDGCERSTYQFDGSYWCD